MKKAFSFAAATFCIAAATGGSAVLINALAAEPKQCPKLDTQKILEDLSKPFRTDQEWYETIIKKLIYQLECERK